MSEALHSLDRLEKVEIVDPFTVIVHAKGGDALLEQRLAVWGSEIVSQRAFVAAGSGSGGPQPLLEAVLTSSSTTSSIFVSRWLPTIRIGAVGRRSMASNTASFPSVPRA